MRDHMPATRLLALAVVSGFAVAACAGLGTDPVIDTWPVGGGTADCTTVGCAEMIRVGLAGLDARDRGHAEVVSSELHALGTCLNPTSSSRIMNTFGGYPTNVLVVKEADNSTHAIGVGGSGMDPMPRVTPWLLDTPGCSSPSPTLP